MSRQRQGDGEPVPVAPESDTRTMDRPGVGVGEPAVVVGRMLDDLEPGTRVGDYAVVRLLGAGGCARVYEAKHPVLQRRVAVKVLNHELTAHPAMVQRFIREAQVVNKIHHPNIADISDFGTLPDGRPYYVMEFIEGPNLARVVLERGRLSPSEVADFIGQLCSALQAAHDVGVVHRDVKGTNVMLVKGASGQVVKLLDFGIAKLLHPEPGEVPLTTESQQLGSPPYMAPEQILGQPVDARTDVYSLGVMLHYLLTGALPFWSRDVVALFRMHLEAERPRPSVLAPVSAAIDAVVTKCMAVEPAQRYSSVKDVAEAFRHAVGATLEGVRQATPTPQRTARACALQVEVHFDDGAPDSAIELGCSALVALEGELTHAGYQLFLQTAQALLGVRLLSDDVEESRGIIRDGIALAERLHDGAAPELSAAGVRLTVFLHVGDVDIRIGAQGVTVTGGPLVNTADWPIEATRGWYATRAALVLING